MPNYLAIVNILLDLRFRLFAWQEKNKATYTRKRRSSKRKIPFLCRTCSFFSKIVDLIASTYTATAKIRGDHQKLVSYSIAIREHVANHESSRLA
ncbi:hypothetical protein CEXT_180841 [Caerostris extrusa]|uniref:Uncharacterized protein n=1 Tax=Caerostris extrusa TaxID=172846 RepID=A0AAV4X7Y4_CAEEX|nr:hypothetical protein CEXT_180841 [Caerostris extrusa]